MDQPGIRAPLRIFIFIIVQMIPAAAAEIVSNWTCTVTRLHDGLYKYQLSSPSHCKMGWEDMNKTAYAHNFNFDPHRVHNVTREYIVLKSCQDYMHFTEDCLKHDAVEEVHCRVNCTALSSPTVIEDLQPTSVNVTDNLTCIFGSWCPETWIAVLLIGCPFVLLAIGFIAVRIRRRVKRRRERREMIEYIPANGEIKVQMV